jgi:hypothetical protein
MAQIDPMMGLRLWTQGLDPYDHDQLATNFSKLALHDHTPGRGVQIPTEGIFDGAITTAKLVDGAVTTAKIGDLQVTNAKLAAGSTVQAGNIDPAVLNSYRTVINRGYRFDAVGGGAYLLSASGGDGGTGIVPTNAAAGNHAFYLNPADYAIPTKTTYYRIRASALTNAVAPGNSYSVNLYSVTPAGGGAGAVTLTLGTAAGTYSFPTLTATSSANGVSADFAAPAAGFYVLSIGVGGNGAASSSVAINATLQVRNA